MKAKGLDPSVKTLVLASGGEGVGDFPAIVKSIAAEVKGPFQIVAVCAKNESHFKNLNALKADLPPEIKLVPLGQVAGQRMLVALGAGIPAIVATAARLTAPSRNSRICGVARTPPPSRLQSAHASLKATPRPPVSSACACAM